MKLKAVLDQSQIQTDHQKDLKQFRQQLKTVITWLTSMGYFSSINSIKNVTKAVMRLPKNLRTSYYKSSDDTNFNENNINFISFERWLANETLFAKPYCYTYRKHNKVQINQTS